MITDIQVPPSRHSFKYPLQIPQQPPKLNLLLPLKVPTCICPFPLVGSQLFAHGVNLNWPIRAQSGTCSSRFHTAVDVEHDSRMFVLQYGRILFKFSTTKMVLWSPWGFCMMGNLCGCMEIWFLWWFVAPHPDESFRTIVRMERTGRPSTLF